MATIRPAPITPLAHSIQRDSSAKTAANSSGTGDASRAAISSRNSDLSSSTLDECQTAGEKTKRLPPNKAKVGLAKSPDIKSCKSKIGSLNNIKHTPAGGSVVIPTQKLKWEVNSKIGSLDNKEHKPGGGKLKVQTRKLEWNTTSKVQSLQNVGHKPGGGNVKIFNESYVDKSMLKRVTKANETVEQDNANATEVIDCSRGQALEANTKTPKTISKTSTSSKVNESLTRGMKGLGLKD